MDEIKVIIADDNIEILDKIKEIIEKMSGIKLLGIAKDGKEEYEMIKKMKPDLVLTDLEMPKLTGIEVLEKLKEENTEKMPQVIFITGKPSTDFIKRAIKIGALDIVYKPFKDEKIEDVIERNKNAILEENALKTENNSMIEQTSLFKKIMRKIRNNFNSIMNISKEKGF
ncbi:MAG: response regulator [Clostridia bacterium]|nr:response regulator [Clostridium sp.]MBS6252741.1 response regulator [Clostridium sp.]